MTGKIMNMRGRERIMRGRERKNEREGTKSAQTIQTIAKTPNLKEFLNFSMFLVFWSHSFFFVFPRSCSLLLARSCSLFLVLPRSSPLFLCFFCFSLCFAYSYLHFQFFSLFFRSVFALSRFFFALSALFIFCVFFFSLFFAVCLLDVMTSSLLALIHLLFLFYLCGGVSILSTPGFFLGGGVSLSSVSFGVHFLFLNGRYFRFCRI